MDHTIKRTQILLEKGFISETQAENIKSYRTRNFFSLRGEIFFLFFLGVFLFTTGCSILIYKNIDTIGHVAILAAILLTSLVCFYISFKQSPGFSKEHVVSKNQAIPYLLLTANLLGGIFIGYLQFQYSTFGTHYALATLLPTLLYFFSAYYFDHKGVLALAISGLCAVAGFSTNPRALLEMDFSGDTYLSYSALGIGFLLIAWVFYADKKEIKKHFDLTYLNFALHIFCIACLSNLFSDYWILWLIPLTAILYYFMKLAYRLKSYNFYIFFLIYAYIAFNFTVGRMIHKLDLGLIIMYVTPLYFIASIVFFVNRIRTFRKHVRNEGV